MATSEAPAPSTKSSRPRPVLRHSNNLHCGSFLELHTTQYRDEKENISRKRRSKSENDEQALRRRFGLQHQNSFSEDYGNNNTALGRIVTQKDEWGKFHSALREKRSRCATHASIQQYINQLVENQGREMMEQRQDGEMAMVSPAPIMQREEEEEARQRRIYSVYRQFVASSRRQTPVFHSAHATNGEGKWSI